MKKIYSTLLILAHFSFCFFTHGVLGDLKDVAKLITPVGIVNIPLQQYDTSLVFRACVLLSPNTVLVDLYNIPLNKELLNSEIQIDFATRKVKQIYITPTSYENSLVFMSFEKPLESIKPALFAKEIKEVGNFNTSEKMNENQRESSFIPIEHFFKDFNNFSEETLSKYCKTLNHYLK